MQHNSRPEWISSRRTLLKSCALLPFAYGSGAFSAEPAHNGPIQNLVDAFLVANKVDALSVGLIHDGTAEFYNAGTISRRTNVPASQFAIYEIGSITKTFTGLLLAHAVIEGRLRLTDEVDFYLPAGYDNLRHGGRAITFADIVTTTSGLPDNLPDWKPLLKGVDPRELPFRISDMFRNYSTKDFEVDLKHAHLVDAPGKTPRHSNVASELLAIVLERVYGRPYDVLLFKYIERPLKMGAGRHKASARLMATGYDGIEMPPETANPIFYPAGGLRCSTSDMARYLGAQIAADDPSIRLTHNVLWGSADEAAIGFHWLIAKAPDSQTYYRHTGGTFGFTSYCDFYPARRYGIALLTNRGGPGLDAKLQELADEIHAKHFGYPQGLRALENALEASDYIGVGNSVTSVKSRYPELHLSESFMNDWGYRLLSAGRAKAACEVLGYNTFTHANSGNAHDSYAEALAAAGEKAQALSEYRRSLFLDPSNENARTMIARIQGK